MSFVLIGQIMILVLYHISYINFIIQYGMYGLIRPPFCRLHLMRIMIIDAKHLSFIPGRNQDSFFCQNLPDFCFSISLQIEKIDFADNSCRIFIHHQMIMVLWILYVSIRTGGSQILPVLHLRPKCTADIFRQVFTIPFIYQSVDLT